MVQELSKFPSGVQPDLVNYLIFTKSFYTMEDVKAWKSLEAYNQLTSGWISDVAVFVEKVGGLCEDRFAGFGRRVENNSEG